MNQIKNIAMLFVFVFTSLFADEGMWTFDNPPLKLFKSKI